MLLIGVTIVRSGFVDRPWTVAIWAASAVSLAAGIATGRWLASRLAFHAYDGPIAAEALHPATRCRYIVTWLVIGLSLIVVMTLIARPSLLIISPPAYLAGLFVGYAVGGFVVPGMLMGKANILRATRTWLKRPLAGIMSATVIILSLSLAAPSFGREAFTAAVSVEAVLTVLALTVVDDDLVRFMTISGHGSQSVLVHHIFGVLPFTAIVVPISFFMFGMLIAGIILAVVAAGVSLMTLRVLAYRICSKRSADFLVSIFIGVLALTAFTMPIAVPFITIALLWQLQRRASSKTWLIA